LQVRRSAAKTWATCTKHYVTGGINSDFSSRIPGLLKVGNVCLFAIFEILVWKEI